MFNMFTNISYVQQNMLQNGITAQQQKQNCINAFLYPAPLSSEMCGPKIWWNLIRQNLFFNSLYKLWKLESWEGEPRDHCEAALCKRACTWVYCSLGHPWVRSDSQLKRDLLLWKNEVSQRSFSLFTTHHSWPIPKQKWGPPHCRLQSLSPGW